MNLLQVKFKVWLQNRKLWRGVTVGDIVWRAVAKYILWQQYANHCRGIGSLKWIFPTPWTYINTAHPRQIRQAKVLKIDLGSVINHTSWILLPTNLEGQATPSYIWLVVSENCYYSSNNNLSVQPHFTIKLFLNATKLIDVDLRSIRWDRKRQRDEH